MRGFTFDAEEGNRDLVGNNNCPKSNRSPRNSLKKTYRTRSEKKHGRKD